MLHMLNFVAYCFALQIWDTESIDVPSHTEIFPQNKDFKDVFINSM